MMVSDLRRTFQRRAHRRQLLAELINGPYPVGHDIGAPSDEDAHLANQCVIGLQLNQVAPHSRLISDHPRIPGIRFALTPVPRRCPVDSTARQVPDLMVGTMEHCQQQRCFYSDQIHCPGDLTRSQCLGLSDQCPKVGLVVEDPAGQKDFAGTVEATGPCTSLPTSTPTKILSIHSPPAQFVQVSPRRSTRRSLNSDDFAGLNSAARKVLAGRAATPIEPHPTR